MSILHVHTYVCICVCITLQWHGIVLTLSSLELFGLSSIFIRTYILRSHSYMFICVFVTVVLKPYRCKSKDVYFIFLLWMYIHTYLCMCIYHVRILEYKYYNTYIRMYVRTKLYIRHIVFIYSQKREILYVELFWTVLDEY